MRFGIGVHDSLTLDEIGTRLSVTRERIRQIETKALRKLRRSELTEHLMSTAARVESEDRDLLQESKEPEGIDSLDTASEVPKHQVQKRPVDAKASQLHKRSDRAKPTVLAQVLAKAEKLGVLVEDGRQTSACCIWVRLLATPDAQHRALARKLIELGFQHAMGKGYWK